MKFMKMRLVGHVAHMGELKN